MMMHLPVDHKISQLTNPSICQTTMKHDSLEPIDGLIASHRTQYLSFAVDCRVSCCMSALPCCLLNAFHSHSTVVFFLSPLHLLDSLAFFPSTSALPSFGTTASIPDATILHYCPADVTILLTQLSCIGARYVVVPSFPSFDITHHILSDDS